MPLSAPADDRTPVHTRRVTCEGYRRADGLWDIEGRVVDTKAYAFESRERGTVEVGDPLHDMWMRLTVDDDMVIRAVEAVTDKSPFRICPDITPNFQRLVGLKVGAGFLRQSRRLLGGVEGCTHLVELLGPMATTAFQTISPILQRERGAAENEPGGAGGERRRPALLGTCHAYAPWSEVTAHFWPEFSEPRPKK